MINKASLTQLLSQNITTQYAALTDEDKAALLTFKQNFLQSLRIGDSLLGFLFEQNGEIIFEEVKTKLQFQAGLVDDLNKDIVENKKKEFIVKAVEGDKLQLALKELPPKEQPFLSEKAISTLNLPQTTEMKELIETFTQFELPLDRQILMDTYRHVQTTKLPKEVLINLLKQFPLNIKEAFENIDKAVPRPLYKEMSVLLKKFGEIVGENKVLGVKFLNSLLPFVDEQAMPAFKVICKEYENNISSLMKVIKYFEEENLILRRESLSKEGLKEQLITKNAECLKTLIEVIKEEEVIYENLTLPVAEAEKGLLTWQKLNEQGHYFTFPWLTDLGEAEGEVYFYKPKKNKRGKKENLYTVIALDMPNINHIEVHIHQIEKSLDLTLYIEQEEIKEVINKSLSKLIYLLEDKGYHLSRCSCQLASKKEHNQSLENLVNEMPIRGIDFKI